MRRSGKHKRGMMGSLSLSRPLSLSYHNVAVRRGVLKLLQDLPHLQTHTHALTQSLTHARTHARTSAHTIKNLGHDVQIFSYICMHISAHICVIMNVHSHIAMFIYMHMSSNNRACMHGYIHPCMHMRIFAWQ